MVSEEHPVSSKSELALTIGSIYPLKKMQVDNRLKPQDVQGHKKTAYPYRVSDVRYREQLSRFVKTGRTSRSDLGAMLHISFL